ncbi:unnamed protein product [Danaus chrysippus]|uniref:(African queen) hypothetical protein n=1 Tax=Danaus chrysippus TaxID=151541 RepID=A0A8J2QQD9_9NEOP|nr:unnamed protein product [Danaus chrysippus]
MRVWASAPQRARSELGRGVSIRGGRLRCGRGCRRRRWASKLHSVSPAQSAAGRQASYCLHRRLGSRTPQHLTFQSQRMTTYNHKLSKELLQLLQN